MAHLDIQSRDLVRKLAAILDIYEDALGVLTAKAGGTLMVDIKGGLTTERGRRFDMSYKDGIAKFTISKNQ